MVKTLLYKVKTSIKTANIDPIGFVNLKRVHLCAILLPVDVIAFGRVRRVVIGGYVAGKNLDWYLGHKYAHNAYNCTRRSR